MTVDYCICNITIILECVVQKTKYFNGEVFLSWVYFFIITGVFSLSWVFFSLVWLSFHYRGCFIHIPYTVMFKGPVIMPFFMFNMCIHHLGI